MPSAAEPFTELLCLTKENLVEGRRTIEAAGNGKIDGDTAAYSCQSLIAGVDRLRLLSRRYSATPEYRSGATILILSDAAFRAAIEGVAAELEASRAMGAAAPRIADTLRRWIATASPEHSRTLGAQADAALRVLKRKAR
jgi:hypothetical protein